MNLREYMDTHDGDYSLAESTTAVTVVDLDLYLRELEVEEYLVGCDHDGQQKLHIYGVTPHVHLVSRLTPRSVELEPQPSSRQHALVRRLASV